MAHNMADNGLKYLSVGEGAEQRAIAVRARDGAAPGLLWLGGYKSDMQGTKAQALAGWAAQQGRASKRGRQPPRSIDHPADHCRVVMIRRCDGVHTQNRDP